MSNSTSSTRDKLVATSKAAATDWFAANISASPGQRPGEALKHTIMFVSDASTVVNIHYDIDGTTDIVMGLNAGVAILANSLHIEDILIPLDTSGGTTSWNIQHASGTNTVTCFVFETATAMV